MSENRAASKLRFHRFCQQERVRVGLAELKHVPEAAQKAMKVFNGRYVGAGVD